MRTNHFQSTKIQSTKSSVEVETTEVQAIQSALDPSDPETKNVGLREIREDKVPPPHVPPMIKALTAEHQISSKA